jgi:hypothetical protein
MGSYNFEQDLTKAKKTEQQIADLLHTKYGFLILEISKSKDYDLLVKERDKKLKDGFTYQKGRYWKIEVKEDFGCARTGNVALEYSCRGQPSGISTTHADYYIYKIHTDSQIVYISIATSRLREMVRKKMYFREVNGGDAGSNSLNYLFKYGIFTQEVEKQSRIFFVEDKVAS